MFAFKTYGWMDLSTPQKPSYALVLRQAVGHEVSPPFSISEFESMLMLDQENNLVKYHDMWMTAKQAKILKRLNKDAASIDESPAMPVATSVARPVAMPVAIPAAIKEPIPPKVPIMDLPYELRRLILEHDAIEFLQRR